jgi:hypothetical protein
MAVGRIALDPLSTWRTPMAANHIGGHARLVDEDQSAPGEQGLARTPMLACFYDIRPKLLGSVNAFF